MNLLINFKSNNYKNDSLQNRYRKKEAAHFISFGPIPDSRSLKYKSNRTGVINCNPLISSTVPSKFDSFGTTNQALLLLVPRQHCNTLKETTFLHTSTKVLPKLCRNLLCNRVNHLIVRPINGIKAIPFHPPQAILWADASSRRWWGKNSFRETFAR